MEWFKIAFFASLGHFVAALSYVLVLFIVAFSFLMTLAIYQDHCEKKKKN